MLLWCFFDFLGVLIFWFFDGVVTKTGAVEDIDNDLKELVMNTKTLVDKRMDELRVADSLDVLFEIFRRCNKYIDETMPWVLAKDESKKDRLNEVLYNIVLFYLYYL